MNAEVLDVPEQVDLVGQLATMALALDMVDSDFEEFGTVREETINFVRKVRDTA